MYNKDMDYVLPVNCEEPTSSPKKNKRWLIIILAIVLVIVVTFVCLLVFSDSSIKGGWELTVNPEIQQSTPDEIDDRQRVYYEFSEPGEYGDGEYTTYFDSGVEHGQYKLSEKDGKKYINLGTIDLEYTIEGFKLFGNAEMTIIYPENTNEQTGEVIEEQKYIFEQDSVPDYSNESYDDYFVDDALTGEWASNERSLSYFYYTLPYVQTVNFTDDGVMTIHYESEDLALDRYMYYAYTAKDNKLTFSLVTDKDTKYTVSYKFDDKGNLKFIDDKTTNSIFSDAFFGDFTFYTPENLPEPTQQPTEK